MRRTIRLITIYFLLLSKTGLSQADSSLVSTPPLDTVFLFHQHAFKVDLLPLADWINTSARFTYEQKIGQHFSVSAGGGVAYNLWNIGKYDLTPAREIGGNASVEFRYYFSSFKINGYDDPYYFGLRGSYYQHDMTKRMSFQHDTVIYNQKEPTLKTYIRQTKEVYGLYITGGTVLHNGWHDFVELHFGIGTIFRRMNNVTDPEWGRPFFFHAYRWAIASGESTRWWTPAFYVNVRYGLGWGE